MWDGSCKERPIDHEDAVDPADLILQIKFLVKIFPVLAHTLWDSLRNISEENICIVSEVRWGKGGREDEFAVQENTHTTKSPREIATVKSNKWTPI